MNEFPVNSLLSVIVPIYNTEEHLPKCIESILGQTYHNLELILVDDGSTDNSLSICKKYEKKDNRVRVLHKNNSGVSTARNQGIEISKGEFIAFVDGDDWIEDSMYDRIMTNSLSILNICGLCMENEKECKIADGFLKFITTNTPKLYDKSDIMLMIKYNLLSSPCNKIYSNKIIKENHIYFDTNMTYGEDRYFNLKYCNFIEGFHVLNLAPYHYMRYQGVISSSSRYHKYFHETSMKLYAELNKWVRNKDDDDILTAEMFPVFINVLINIFHKDSGLTLKNKFHDIKRMLTSNEYIHVLSGCNKSNIGLLYKIVLKSQNCLLLFFFHFIVSLRSKLIS